MNPLTNPSPAGETSQATILLRPHSLKELTALYNISRKTFKKWLLPFEKEIGERIGNYYTIPQVRKIFMLLGFPALFHEEGGNGS